MSFHAIDGGRNLLPLLEVSIDVTNAPTNSTRVWTDITTDVRSLRYSQAGRNDELQQSQPGSLMAVLSNTKAKYDPTNSSGLGIKRRQWLRVRAQWNGVTYARWTGIITTISQTWPEAGKDAIVTIQAKDALQVAALYDLQGQTFAAQRSDLRVSSVAGLAGLTAVADDVGSSTLVASSTAFSSQSFASQHLTDIERTENGQIFADASGNLRFQSRHYRLLNASVSLATIGDNPGEIPYKDSTEFVSDDAYICNHAEVTPTNADGSLGTVQVADNATSATTYFKSTPQMGARTILVSSTAEALSCAQYLTNRYGDPSPRVPKVDLIGAKATTMWPTILGMVNSQRYTFKRRATNTITPDVYVEQVSEQITPGLSWVTSVQLSPAVDQAGWVLGSAVNSLLGQTTRVLY